MARAARWMASSLRKTGEMQKQLWGERNQKFGSGHADSNVPIRQSSRESGRRWCTWIWKSEQRSEVEIEIEEVSVFTNLPGREEGQEQGTSQNRVLQQRSPQKETVKTELRRQTKDQERGVIETWARRFPEAATLRLWRSVLGVPSLKRR